MNDMGDMNNSISPNGDSAVLLLAGFERYIRVFGAVEIKSSEDKVWKRLKTSGGCGVSCRRILMPALITEFLAVLAGVDEFAYHSARSPRSSRRCSAIRSASRTPS